MTVFFSIIAAILALAILLQFCSNSIELLKYCCSNDKFGIQQFYRIAATIFQQFYSNYTAILTQFFSGFFRIAAILKFSQVLQF